MTSSCDQLTDLLSTLTTSNTSLLAQLISSVKSLQEENLVLREDVRALCVDGSKYKEEIRELKEEIKVRICIPLYSEEVEKRRLLFAFRKHFD